MSKQLKCCSLNVWGTADPPFVPSVGVVKSPQKKRLQECLWMVLLKVIAQMD